MASSPSEFLTFYRRAATGTTLRRSLQVKPLTARPFSSTITARATGDPKHKEHATRKGDSLDIQSHAVKQGTQSKATSSGGHATEERDSSGSVTKAKQEHPEAPDPAIGMQDERGGKETK